ncbi:MAG TPA: aquaporin [Candidatus Limnocylindrales bacterium]|jgi:aquaporin Z
MNAQKYLAELIGTFILVGVGSLSIVAAGATGAPLLAVVPFGFGFGLLAAIVAVGHVSGGHFNPAVTVGAFLDKRIGVNDSIAYVIAQAVGAILASTLVLVVAGDRSYVAGTANTPGADVSVAAAFLVEVVLTALFLLVILNVTRRDPGHAVFVIPLTLAVIHFAGIPFSGASVNPARSLGPALVGGELDSLWIYLTAPFVGAVIGWAASRLFEAPEEKQAEMD